MQHDDKYIKILIKSLIILLKNEKSGKKEKSSMNKPLTRLAHEVIVSYTFIFGGNL